MTKLILDAVAPCAAGAGVIAVDWPTGPVVGVGLAAGLQATRAGVIRAVSATTRTTVSSLTIVALLITSRRLCRAYHATVLIDSISVLRGPSHSECPGRQN